VSVLPQLERDLAEVARRRLASTGSSGVWSRFAGLPVAARRWRLTPSPLVAALGIAVALAVGAIAIGSLRDQRVPPPTFNAASAGYHAVTGLVGGLAQSGRHLGSSSAPVRVTLYGDLECQQCSRFLWSTQFARFVNADVRNGRAQIAYRSLCTATCDVRRMRVFDAQQAAAYAAGQQGLFWQYALLFYREHGHAGTAYVPRRYLVALADQVPGLNVGRWQSARRSPGLLHGVRQEERAATRAHVLGTPTLGFRGPRAALTLAVGRSYTVLAEAVRAAEFGCPKPWRRFGFVHCRDFV
jgi:protein-disulfide isomerase